MRLLHPDTIKYVAYADDTLFDNATVSRRQILSHAWSEVFKFYGSGRSHPKMFINNDFIMGLYLKLLYDYKDYVGCKFNQFNVLKLPTDVRKGFDTLLDKETIRIALDCFTEDYLISDLNSLYYKGVNLFLLHYGDNWQKYVPVESLKEIQRQITKTLEKRRKV